MKLYLPVALAVAVFVLSACSEVPGEVVDPVDCSWSVIEQSFPGELTGIATGDWATPAVEHPAIPLDLKYAHQLNFLVSPMMPPWMDPVETSGPVILYGDNFETMVFSPLNHFGSAWMKVENGAIRYGMHGDTERVPAGTIQRFIVVEGEGINHTVQCWGTLMRRDRATTPPDRYADSGLSRLGYWTDNGAAYYYATEGDLNESDTLLAVKAGADDLGIPYGYFQIDSWWYRKQRPDRINPGGLITWEPYEDKFPDGLAAFRQALGLPLVAHNRWFSVQSPYLDRFEFVVDEDPDAEMAIPTGPGVYEEFMQSCLDWGVETYEQDWLVNQYFGSRWLRDEPGHLETWLANIHDSAAAAGLTTQICMAGGAHLMEAAGHSNVTTVRTSIDYAADVCKECYWPQFFTNNMLAGALGIWPFKDNFHSGESHGQAEALISSLSAGMVGTGDAIGGTVRDIVMSTCRADGVLLKPDRPATPIDPMFLPHARPFTVTTESARDGMGRWTYVAAFNMGSEHPQREDSDRVWAVISYDGADIGKMFQYPALVTDWSFDMTRDIGQSGRRVMYDWRTGQATVITDTFALPVVADLNDFAYVVLAPVQSNGLALIGEPGKFITMADRRFTEIRVFANGFDITVEGKPGETVTVVGYDADAGWMLEPATAVIGPDGKASLQVGRILD